MTPIRLDGIDSYQPGDPPPDGYIEWHGWADVQRRAGLRQRQCELCRLWHYPQELSGRTVRTGRVVCNPCAPPPAGGRVKS